MILELPEIFNNVTLNLNQIDLLNLSLVSHRFYQLTKPRMFNKIRINSNYTRFDKEYNSSNTNTTYITKTPKINQFLKSTDLKLVKRFEVIKLPLEFIDFEKQLILNLNKFENMQELIIEQSCEIYKFYELLNNLHTRKLVKLSIKLNKLSKLNKPAAVKFKLASLSIGPVNEVSTLIDILDKLTDPELTTDLKLFKKFKKIQLNDLINFPPPAKSHELNLSRFLNLKKLSLNNLNLTNSDLLNVNLIELEFLELNNINEFNDSNEERENLLSYLLERNENFPNLKRLKLNIRQALIDSIPLFLSKLYTNQLEELELVLRYNNMKLIEDVNELIQLYIDQIKLQSNSLIKLSFEIKIEKNLIELSKQLTINQLQNLMSTSYKSLRSFRFEAKFNNLIDLSDSLFNNFPKLEQLWVLNSTSVDHHWGLGNVYPGIFDNWLRIQHLPKTLINKNGRSHPLRYIKVDKYLFEIKKAKDNEIIPRDTIDEWFNDLTTINFH